MAKLLWFYLLCTVSAIAQSPETTIPSQAPSTIVSSNGQSSSSTLSASAIQTSSSTIEALASITPFQVPFDVLQGLGLPLNVPSAEQPANPAAWAPAVPPNAGRPGSPGGKIAQQPAYGSIAFQAGLPFDRYKPRVLINLTSITGAGHYTIYSCYNKHLSHRSAASHWSSSLNRGLIKPPTSIVPTKVIVTTLTNSNVPTISRCDNVTVVPSERVTPISLTFANPWTTTVSTFPTPGPSCMLKEHQCDQAYTAYSTKTYSHISSVYSAHFASRRPGLPGQIEFIGDVKPPCPTAQSSCPPTSEIDSCKLEARTATLYYWPTTLSGDFCTSGSARTTAGGTGKLSIAVFDNFTVTSPSPLMIVPSITRSVMPPPTMVENESDLVYRACGYQKDLTLAVDPALLSSIRTVLQPTKTVRRNYTFSTQYGSTTRSYPFDFAHLADGQVAWDAFVGVGNCAMRGIGLCDSTNKTIRPSAYRPILAFANVTLQAAEASFAGCTLPTLQAGHGLQLVPITAPTLTEPSATKFGATVSVGPITTKLENSKMPSMDAMITGYQDSVEIDYSTLDPFQGFDRSGAMDMNPTNEDLAVRMDLMLPQSNMEPDRRHYPGGAEEEHISLKHRSTPLAIATATSRAGAGGEQDVEYVESFAGET